MAEIMVTEVHLSFSGPSHGALYMRGFEEDLWETKVRAVDRVKDTFGKNTKIKLTYQAEVFYEKGTGRELRRLVY